MPRGVKLTEDEITKIKAYRDCCLSNRQIAKKIHRSLCAVNNCIKLGDNYGKKRRPGRKSQLSDRDKRRIIKLAGSNSMFASEINVEISCPVGTRRIQQILQSSDYLEFSKRLPKPALTKPKKRG